VRHAAWGATDSVYKSAVETLARKVAYMEERHVTDRPDDFARTDPVVSIEDKVTLSLEVPRWEDVARRLSARLGGYRHVLDSSVTLTASADNRSIINSEGSRVRTGDQAVALVIAAEAQAADGEQLAERFTRHARRAEELPSESELMADIDALARRLEGRATAPILEQYIGPVLFDEEAAPQLFESMLAGGVANSPDPVGGGRRRFAGTESLEKYLGKRVLPRTFDVYDDPSVESFAGEMLAGHYEFDDEGVAAQRVNLVSEGKLQGMLKK
jgi:predicted Zn-dependent protease